MPLSSNYNFGSLYHLRFKEEGNDSQPVDDYITHDSESAKKLYNFVKTYAKQKGSNFYASISIDGWRLSQEDLKTMLQLDWFHPIINGKIDFEKETKEFYEREVYFKSLEQELRKIQ